MKKPKAVNEMKVLRDLLVKLTKVCKKSFYMTKNGYIIPNLAENDEDAIGRSFCILSPDILDITSTWFTKGNGIITVDVDELKKEIDENDAIKEPEELEKDDVYQSITEMYKLVNEDYTWLELKLNDVEGFFSGDIIKYEIPRDFAISDKTSTLYIFKQMLPLITAANYAGNVRHTIVRLNQTTGLIIFDLSLPLFRVFCCYKFFIMEK